MIARLILALTIFIFTSQIFSFVTKLHENGHI